MSLDQKGGSTDTQQQQLQQAKNVANENQQEWSDFDEDINEYDTEQVAQPPVLQDDDLDSDIDVDESKLNRSN